METKDEAQPAAGLFRASFSVTRTRRRRLLWCVWWTAEPCADPFRPPDAWSGGARDLAEAQQEATRAAGMPVVQLEGRWAGAWVRVQAGLPPFVERPSRAPATTRPIDPHVVLGVAPEATLAEVKNAFRKLALVSHPDHGGDAATFIALKDAYERLVERRRRPRRR